MNNTTNGYYLSYNVWKYGIYTSSVDGTGYKYGVGFGLLRRNMSGGFYKDGSYCGSRDYCSTNGSGSPMKNHESFYGSGSTRGCSDRSIILGLVYTLLLMLPAGIA